MPSPSATYRAVLSACCAITAVALAPAGAAARSLEEISNSGEIRYCIAPVHPAIAVATPAECLHHECTFSGSAPDIAREFTHTLGDRIKDVFRRVTWQQQFEDADGNTRRDDEYTPRLLETGECDLFVGGLTKNAWRLKKLDFVTLHPSRMMVVVNRQKKSAFDSPASLAGGTAAILANTSYHAWLQEQNATTYADNPIKIELVGPDERISKVDGGSLDFTMLDANLALWSTRHQANQSVAAFAVGPVEEIGWAFRKSDKVLQQAVGAFFAEQRADRNSRLNAIWKQTFGLSMTQFMSLVAQIK